MRMFRVVVNGSEYKVEIEEMVTKNVPQSGPLSATIPPANNQIKPATAKVEPAVAGGNVIAPMPGTVLHVAVNIGDSVTKGQVLLVLEAMKMENEIMAPTEGVVRELNVNQGVSVNAGDILVVLS